MLKFLRNIDFCFSIVGLNYKGNHRYKSWVGGILSIMVFIIFISIVAYYLVSFFERKTPKMSFQNLKYWQAPRYDLSENFTLAIMMEINNTYQFREDLIQIKAQYINKSNSKYEVVPINIVECNRGDYIDNEEYFDKLQLDKAICFDMNHLYLEGNSVSEVYSYVQIQFLLCLSEQDCFDQTEIENMFRLVKPLAYVYFIDTTFQTDKKKRVVNFINYIEVNVTFNNAKVTNIYFSNNEMRVDNSYFFASQPKIYQNYMIDSYRDLVSVRTDYQNEALLINLLSSKNKQIINITYMQLSELLANVGAVINIILFFITLFGDYVNHYFFQNELTNALFFFQNESKGAHIIKERYNTTITHKSLDKHSQQWKSVNNNCFLSSSKTNLFEDRKKGSIIPMFDYEKNLNLTHYNIKTKLKTKTMKINIKNNQQFQKKRKKAKIFTNFEILYISLFQHLTCARCQHCHKSLMKYELIQNHLFAFQDLINVYKKIQEIDLIKYIIFTEKQLQLYKAIPKPVVKIKENNHKYSYKLISFPHFVTGNNLDKFHKTQTQEMVLVDKNEKSQLIDVGEILLQSKHSIDNKLLSIIKLRNEFTL